MTNLLKHFFLTRNPNLTPQQLRERYGALSGGVGIILNLLLSLSKLWAGFLTASIAITADGLNNLTDMASSVVTLVGFRLAGQKPDPEHPFGHGRMEYLSGLLISVLIFLVGFELLQASILKIITPTPTSFSPLTFGILFVSVAIKLWMAYFNHNLATEINSTALEATAVDSRSDALATSAVMVGALIAEGSSLPLDGPIGLLVAFLILKAGWSTLQDTIDPLLGKPPTPELVQAVYTRVLSRPLITGLHDLIIHDYGPGRSMMSLHVEVSVSADLMEVHDIIDELERELLEEFGILTSIHTDPIETTDPRCHQLREQVLALMVQIDPQLSIHDFRTTLGPNHTNILFDVVVPHDFHLSDEELRTQVTGAITALDPTYRTILLIDHSFL